MKNERKCLFCKKQCESEGLHELNGSMPGPYIIYIKCNKYGSYAYPENDESNLKALKTSNLEILLEKAKKDRKDYRDTPILEITNL